MCLDEALVKRLCNGADWGVALKELKEMDGGVWGAWMEKHKPGPMVFSDDEDDDDRPTYDSASYYRMLKDVMVRALIALGVQEMWLQKPSFQGIIFIGYSPQFMELWENTASLDESKRATVIDICSELREIGLIPVVRLDFYEYAGLASSFKDKFRELAQNENVSPSVIEEIVNDMCLDETRIDVIY